MTTLDLKAKYDHIKSQRNELLKTQAKAGPAPPSTRLEQMKEEIDLLNSQVQAYKVTLSIIVTLLFIILCNRRTMRQRKETGRDLSVRKRPTGYAMKRK